MKIPLCLKPVLLYLSQWVSTRKYGNISVTFQNGKPCDIKVTENIKPVDIMENEESRTEIRLYREGKLAGEPVYIVEWKTVKEVEIT